MQPSNVQKPYVLLLIGDVMVLLLVTLIGFASHDRLDSGILRILSTFVPLLVGWGLIGVHVGVFDPVRAADPHQLWRPFWAMVLAGPFAGWMRALFLRTEVAPILVIILGGISALSLLAWRSLYLVLNQRFVIKREINETV
jgi:hypothetical protein